MRRFYAILALVGVLACSGCATNAGRHHRYAAQSLTPKATSAAPGTVEYPRVLADPGPF